MFGIGLGLGIGKRIKKLLNAFYILYKTRVLADSGTVEDQSYANKIFNFLEDNSLLADTKLLISPWMGVKERTSSIYTYFTKLFSADATPNDATQTTELNQPYKSGNIAPNEVASILNLDVDYLTHNAISFLSSNAWSLIFCINWNGSGNVLSAIFGKQSDTESIISLRDGSTNRLKLVNDTGTSGTGTEDISGIIGKNAIVQLDADGAGALDVSINGTLLESISIATDIEVSAIFKAMATAGNEFDGRLYYQHLIAQNLTALKATYTAFLRTLIPEIESVQIGSQEWATSNLDIACTPEGNVINEVQLAADWINATTLYDNYLLANPGDTYGATKAAAMWCYYDNDPAKGAIYGKLYNWYAVDLINTDMGTAGFGWHVPTTTELDNLITALGGTSIAGGKIKKDGLSYWNTPNTGADNSSGFTAIPAGRMTAYGFALISLRSYIWSSSAARAYALQNDNSAFSGANFPEILGLTIRLIKD